MKKVILVESTNVEELESLYDTYYEVKRIVENKQTLEIKFKFELELTTI